MGNNSRLHRTLILIIGVMLFIAIICTNTGEKKEDMDIETAGDNSSYDEYNQKPRRVSTSLESLANIGETTFVQADTYASERPLTTGTVTIDKLYTGEEAKKIIRKAFNNHILTTECEDLPKDMTYDVIEYTTSINPQEAYIDIRIEGFDGDNLRYKGVEYAKRTYDILGYSNLASDDRYQKCYCYYAVPMDCSEYVIEMGIFLDELRDKNAYYHIKR